MLSATLIDGNVEENGPKSDESFASTDGWRQAVPDAIKDGAVRHTVESVLEGVEDVLSIFFTNSGSALRRVKAKERTKKRVNGASREVKPAALTSERSADQTLPSNADVNPPENCATLETKSPLNHKDFSQWTPLSLSQVPDSKTKQGCTELNSNAEQGVLRDDITQPSQRKKCCLSSSQLRSSVLAASPALTFARKPRKFVYRVQSPCPSSKERKGNATPDKSTHPAAGKSFFLSYIASKYFVHYRPEIWALPQIKTNTALSEF